MTKREAVQEIERSATTVVVHNAAQKALKEGTDQALTKALVTAREAGTTVHVVNIANKQLGFDE